MRIVLFSISALLLGIGPALAFPTAEVPTSEAAYVAKLKTAAPEEIVAKSTILMTQDGKERSIQTGTNGFACFIAGDGTPLCGDDAGIAWFKAIGAKVRSAKQDRLHLHAGRGHGDHQPRPLSEGDASALGADRPSVMIVGPLVREMSGYPRNADVADPTQPYVMYPGTKYEHLMLPVAAAK